MIVFRLAAAQFAASEPRDFATFADAVGDAVSAAVDGGARLLVFPEYGAMSLAALFDDALRADLPGQLLALQSLRDDYVEMHRALARQHGIYLLAGTFPWQSGDGRFRNRAFLFGPGGDSSWQDKQVMTRFERERWGISAGDALRVFETELGCLGIATCYDIEFPVIARRQVESGAELLLVPSCTDSLHGYWRVRIGAQARALENQCLVVHAPLVGDAPWSPAIDTNVGAAGIYAPPDLGFPEDGVLAIGRMNEPGWVFADVDTARIATVREQGQVLNHRHWREQWGDARPQWPRLPRVRL